jgi:hypothetical protein
MKSAAGIYIVTLNNDAPISVNAHDPRVANRAIAVTRANCKFGKARNLAARKANYERTFGVDNVNFFPIAEVEDISTVERRVLSRLRDFRVRGVTGRKNEWLIGITPAEIEQAVIAILDEGGFHYRRVGSVHTNAAKSLG